MYERGKIRNRKHAKQIVDFSGLRFDKITPTDIDGLIDFHNQVFVFVELKYSDTPLPVGQKLALERIADACTRGGVASYVIVGRHESDGDIPAAACRVDKVYSGQMWKAVPPGWTVAAAVRAIRHRHITNNAQRLTTVANESTIREG